MTHLWPFFTKKTSI